MHAAADTEVDDMNDPESDIHTAAPSEGMRGRPSRNLDNVPLQPMAIVSAEESERGFVRRACNNRVIVFLCGILCAIAISTALGIEFAQPIHEQEPPHWQLGIDLRENERYIFSVSQLTSTSSTIDIDNADLTNSSETSGSFIEYQIEELCGDDQTSWLRFLITDYRGEHSPGIDNLYPRKYSSYLRDNNTLEQTQFSGVLRDLLRGHSWNAKLSHNARNVLRTDNRNIEMMLDYALEEWAHENYDEFRASGSRDQLHADLVRVGRHIISELQEEVYPHLQSSPDALVGEQSVWWRPLRTGPLTLEVKYELMNHRNDLPNATEPGWATARSGRLAASGDRDQEYLLVHQSASLTINTVEQYAAFMATILPHTMINQTKFDDVSMIVALDGDIMVGATTGLVLEGNLTLTNHATVIASFEIDTLAPAVQSSPSTSTTAATTPTPTTVAGMTLAEIRSLYTQWHNTATSRFLSSTHDVSAATAATAAAAAAAAPSSVSISFRPQFSVGGKKRVEMHMKISGITRVRVHGVVILRPPSDAS